MTMRYKWYNEMGELLPYNEREQYVDDMFNKKRDESKDQDFGDIQEQIGDNELLVSYYFTENCNITDKRPFTQIRVVCPAVIRN